MVVKVEVNTNRLTFAASAAANTFWISRSAYSTC